MDPAAVAFEPYFDEGRRLAEPTACEDPLIRPPVLFGDFEEVFDKAFDILREGSCLLVPLLPKL